MMAVMSANGDTMHIVDGEEIRIRKLPEGRLELDINGVTCWLLNSQQAMKLRAWL